MLVSTAKSEIRARLGELTADFWTDAEVLRSLNEGVKRFSSQEKWPWLYTEVTNGAYTANGTSFALPEGVSTHRAFNLSALFSGDTRPRFPRRVSPTEGAKLRGQFYTASSEFLAYYLVSSTDAADIDGLPIVTIRFVPPVNRNATLSYQYIRLPTVLTADADGIDIPEEYAMGPVAWATGNLWLKELQDSKKAEEQFGLYAQVLDDARRESRRLAPDGGFGWGRNEPEFYQQSEDDYTRARIPQHLGP